MKKNQNTSQTFTLFRNGTRLTNGNKADIKAKVLTEMKQFPDDIYLCFDDTSGEYVDIDLQTKASNASTGLKRGRPSFLKPPSTKQKKVGRPSLGVIAREVTLLPRHWEWLSKQSSSASSTLRGLIDEAIRTGVNPLEVRNAMARTDKFMTTALGDQAGYEEASRALYRGDKASFEALIDAWPGDLKNYAKQLSKPAFSADQQTSGEH